MIDEIRKELLRVKACGVELRSDERAGGATHTTVKVTIGSRSFTMAASGLLEILKSLPDGATEASVKAALEMGSAHAE